METRKPDQGQQDEPLREEDVTAEDSLDEREREPLPSEDAKDAGA